VRARLTLIALVAALLAVGAGDPAAHWSITDPGQGPVPLLSGSSGARELSGITWAGGTRYYAVSDKLGKLFPLSIEIDPHSAAISHAAVEPGVLLPGSTDLEGVAYDPEQGTVLVSDEIGPSIREYRVADGSPVRVLALPPVYRNIRKNLGLEALSMDPEHRTLWTANEETLGNDGPRSSVTAGSVIRLQRFDRRYQPTGEWAYGTDPLFGDMLLRGYDLERSGVSDLVALSNGGLLVLERAYGVGGLRIRLYEVDFRGATDVTTVPSLAGADYTPVHKTLLWQHMFPDINYEGAALGPALDGGAHSLVLISDDGHHLRQTLYALSIRPAP
jgi:hypothetical protein